MTFYAFGLNHEHAPVKTAEAFALSPEAQHALYDAVDLQDEAEVIFVSTCNRTEVYLYGTEADVRQVQAVLSARAGVRWPRDIAFHHEDEAAIRHILQVTSGLRSLVLGDGQILAQVKEAYRRAVDAGSVHSLMHRLMHMAFRAAKRVAHETDLASGAASVSTAAVAMARDYFDERTVAQGLQGVHVMLVGAGKMGRLALSALEGHAPASITVTNRSPEKANDVAQAYRALALPWEERHEALADADLVIVATGAPDPVLTAPRVPTDSLGDGTLFIDISMPHNIDPDVRGIPGCTLHDLDALHAWADQVKVERGSSVPEAEAICEDILGDFVTWVFHQQALQPAIQAIRSTFDSIRKQEVDRHAHRTGMDREEVDRLTRSIMQKLLAVPIVKLKNVDPDSIDFVQGIKLLHALFSRPTCEDESARRLRESDGSPSVQLSDTPDACPFHPEDERDADALLERALTAASPADAASS
jgi:glutamyl-tRNA reductase